MKLDDFLIQLVKYCIKLAIQQLETVDFLESFYQIQHKKNQISNFLNHSLEFVKVDTDRGYPDYMNFCSHKYCYLLSSPATNDIIFRINGLYENINRGSQISSENRHFNLISTSQSKINPFKISVHSKKKHYFLINFVHGV